MPPEPLVLAFDTSAAHCAAALLSGGSVLAERMEPMATGQAERLMPMLQEMLAEAGKTWADLAVLGVGTGPGNFTGIRIAVAAARGLALGLGIPAVGVTVLEAMALDAAEPVVVSLDARREALYLQVFPGGTAELKSWDDLSRPPEGATCIGHRADELAALCGGRVARAQHGLCTAIALIAAGRKAGAPRPAPFYLRSADAAPSSDLPPVILP